MNFNTIKSESLQVFHLEAANKIEVLQTLKEWQKSAEEKSKSFKTLSDDKRKVFLSVAHVASMLFIQLGCFPTQDKSAFICRDSLGKIQSLATVENSTNTLLYIVTHPNNIRLEVNQPLSVK
jgi:hypothetical protein